MTTRGEATYPAISELVPHAPPMLALEELVRWEPGMAECRMRVRAENPFVRDGRVDAVVTLELMGQAVAACLGYEAYLGGAGVRAGMIVGSRKMELHRAHLEVGQELTVVAERLRGSDEVSTFECRVDESGQLVANANMTVVHTDEPPG